MYQHKAKIQMRLQMCKMIRVYVVGTCWKAPCFFGVVHITSAASSEKVPSNMLKMCEFTLSFTWAVSSGHLLCIETFCSIQ